MKNRLFLLFFLFSSCTFATHQQFETNLHTYVGQPSSMIIATFGPPKQMTPINSDETVWSYGFSRHSFVGGGISNSYQPFGGNDYFNQTNTLSSMRMREHVNFCTFWFIFGKNHSVKSVGDRGNSCREKKNGSFLPPSPSVASNSYNSDQNGIQKK